MEARDISGVYRGEGVSLDRRPFQCELVVESGDGDGLRLQFIAHDPEGKILGNEDRLLDAGAAAAALRPFGADAVEYDSLLASVLLKRSG